MPEHFAPDMPELQALAQLVARATGELEPVRGVTAIDIQRSAEWAALRSLVFEFVPAARRVEFSNRLLLLEHGRLEGDELRRVLEGDS